MNVKWAFATTAYLITRQSISFPRLPLLVKMQSSAHPFNGLHKLSDTWLASCECRLNGLIWKTIN